MLTRRQGGKTSNDLREVVWRPISLGNHRPTERKTSPWKTWRTAATRLRRDVPARSRGVHTSCNISFRLYVPTVQQMWCLRCSLVGDAVICSDWHIQSKPLHTCFLKLCPPTGSYTAVTKGTVVSRVGGTSSAKHQCCLCHSRLCMFRSYWLQPLKQCFIIYSIWVLL